MTLMGHGNGNMSSVIFCRTFSKTACQQNISPRFSQLSLWPEGDESEWHLPRRSAACVQWRWSAIATSFPLGKTWSSCALSRRLWMRPPCSSIGCISIQQRFYRICSSRNSTPGKAESVRGFSTMHQKEEICYLVQVDGAPIPGDIGLGGVLHGIPVHQRTLNNTEGTLRNTWRTSK